MKENTRESRESPQYSSGIIEGNPETLHRYDTCSTCTLLCDKAMFQAETPLTRVMANMGNMNLRVVPVATSKESKGLLSDRRGEVRVDGSKVCAYSLCESIEGERVVIEQGEVYSLNRSECGILVLMGSRPRNRQLLELHVPQARWEYAVNLYEVQWSKILPVESHGNLFLVGCRLLLGTSRYWSFNPDVRRSPGLGLKKKQANLHVLVPGPTSSDPNSPGH